MRNFSYCGLMKLAGFVKKADPKDLTPDQSHSERNKGLNDNNPAIRWAHENYGFVPQHPDSYLGSANTPDDYYTATTKALTHLDDTVPWPDTGYPLFGGTMHYPGRHSSNDRLNYIVNFRPVADKELMAYNYLRHAGAIGNSAYVNNLTDPPFIQIGSHPYSSKKIVAHEYGHHLADTGPVPERPWLTSPKSRAQYWGRQYVIDPYMREVSAWDSSGVPEGDPVREAALATYRGEPGASARLVSAAGDTYQSPNGIIDMISSNGVPVFRDVDGKAPEPVKNLVRGELYERAFTDPLIIAHLEDERPDPRVLRYMSLSEKKPKLVDSLVPWKTPRERRYERLLEDTAYEPLRQALSHDKGRAEYKYPAFMPDDLHERFVAGMEDALLTPKAWRDLVPKWKGPVSQEGVPLGR